MQLKLQWKKGMKRRFAEFVTGDSGITSGSREGRRAPAADMRGGRRITVSPGEGLRARRNRAVQGGAAGKTGGVSLAAVLPCIFLGLVISCCLAFPSIAAATVASDGAVTEAPLATGAGDQVEPAVDGEVVTYKDLSLAGGWIMRVDIAGPAAEPVAGPGIVAGPDLDLGFFVWQAQDYRVCMKAFAAETESCIVLPAAADAIVFAGDKAVTSHDNKVIRLVNFGTGRSKILDSSTTSGNRYDPAIDGSRAVWVKERGYAGQYYEPLIVDYDIDTDVSTYLTAFGGGASSTGESLYQREAPTISNGEVLYQQRIREPGQQWDIYRAVPGTYGVPVITAPGDQVNPSLDGNLLVYQDNRGGHLDASGEWVGEWDLYLMDLATGVEMPLCTAAGDQINPRISGNTVVWQDNRGGDWDIHSAVLGGEPAAVPEMSVRVGDVLWADFADFQARKLTVRYRFSNNGNGSAHGFGLRQVDTFPAEVTVLSLPGAVETLLPGQVVAAEVHYQVPQGVILFKTSLFASCTSDAGAELWFPRQPEALA